ncbi:zinc finger MYM-type protein 6-like [Latimeria chalumnae]|uniref:zinc finger MYM-type protein 6-like n=1 Tax=Latimeria chalumnae TaxID=7897 RepID=UPI00313C429D
MDKFLIKRKREDEENSIIDSSGTSNMSVTVTQKTDSSSGNKSVQVSFIQPSKVTESAKTNSKAKYRYYDDSYIKYGFISNKCDPPLPLCVIYNRTLSKNSMKPSLLQQQFFTNHSELKNKPIDFFRPKAEDMNKTRNVIHTYMQSSKVALETSYEIALLTARAKKAYSTMETLIIPGALIIAEKMLGDKAVNAIKSIPHSDTSMARRIDEMAHDVQNITLDKGFALQLDESTDVSNNAQLIMYVHYYNVETGITDEILACKSLPGNTTGEEIFNILDSFIRIECNLQWEWCTSISTDGAASMTGHKNGLIARLRSVNPNI